MKDKKQLGLFWAGNTFYLVESANGQVCASACVSQENATGAGQSDDLPEGLMYTQLVRKGLSTQGITCKKAVLSIPTRDLIFRSFNIPFMNSEEVQNVVQFEASKYIPLKLEDLSFSYHTIAFQENNQKQLRILFVAIKKSVLTRYQEILTHAGLQLSYIEPSWVSSVRALKRAKMITARSATSVLLLEQSRGEILFFAEDAIQFVREFPLNLDLTDPEGTGTRLTNDVRVAFNFFNRQNPNQRVNQFLVVANQNISDVLSVLKKEFDTEVKAIRTSQLPGCEKILSNGLLTAYGASAKDGPASSKDFELSGEGARLEAFAKGLKAEFKMIKATTGILAGCALAVFLVVTFSNRMVFQLNAKYEQLTAQQEKFASLETKDLEQMQAEVNKKLSEYKTIRLSSDQTLFLSKIPQLMPDGSWLTNLEVKYINKQFRDGRVTRSVSAPQINLDGFVYLDDVNEQIRIANNFVTMLKNDPDLGAHFKNISLEAVRNQTLQNYKVTYFRIVCQ